MYLEDTQELQFLVEFYEGAFDRNLWISTFFVPFLLVFCHERGNPFIEFEFYPLNIFSCSQLSSFIFLIGIDFLIKRVWFSTKSVGIDQSHPSFFHLEKNFGISPDWLNSRSQLFTDNFTNPKGNNV